VFRQFEPEPFAAASLGQVHRAVTKGGELVAVKVQYPAIRQAVANDFKLLRSTTLTGQVTGHLPKALLDELESGILKETDYLNEARNLEFFRAGLEPLPFVTVPKVFRELSTDRVLTMSYLEGDPALEFLAKAPARPLRDLLGTRLAELFYFQLHGLHALHADGHPGNYFFSPDGQIGLVDFGCVKHFSGSFVEMARALADRAWEKGPEQFDRLLRLIWGPEAPRNRHARRILTKAISVMEEIVPANESDPRLIDCDDSKLVESLSEVITECLRNKLTNPEFVFYMRADLGLFNLLRLLGARFDTSVIFTVRNKLALRRGTGLPACRDGAGRPA
jgi:predicted unusual protein kinase regulating ubiquinone biosynthesis (AarF/ABC1/UbiB family)